MRMKGQRWWNKDTQNWIPTRPCIAEIRNTRNALLTGSDWTQGSDSPLSNSKKAEWATDRQALRDMPATNSSETEFTTVDWPDEPS